MRILSVVGARPNMMKIAPIIAALQSHQDVEHILVHTGQHYDAKMSQVFFDELGLPRPDVDLGVGSDTHARQTARVMEAFEPVALEQQPDWVIVVGDVNSTIACALVCAKLGVKVAHVEAGLRSRDRSMPEEINRLLTDQISDLLFTTEASARTNLVNEGIPIEKVHFVGNVMIDTLVRLLPQARARPTLAVLGMEQEDGAAKPYILVTLHRPGNVDDERNLRILVQTLAELANDLEVVFPIHPRTNSRLRSMGLYDELASCRLLDPLGYLDFLSLQDRASVVLTDSGGVQEETTYLGTPCLTVRPNTERPVTLIHGTNRLVKCNMDELVRAVRSILAGDSREVRDPPPLWDGRSAGRIVTVLLEAESRKTALTATA